MKIGGFEICHFVEFGDLRIWSFRTCSFGISGFAEVEICGFGASGFVVLGFVDVGT